MIVLCTFNTGQQGPWLRCSQQGICSQSYANIEATWTMHDAPMMAAANVITMSLILPLMRFWDHKMESKAHTISRNSRLTETSGWFGLLMGWEISPQSGTGNFQRSESLLRRNLQNFTVSRNTLLDMLGFQQKSPDGPETLLGLAACFCSCDAPHSQLWKGKANKVRSKRKVKLKEAGRFISILLINWMRWETLFGNYWATRCDQYQYYVYRKLEHQTRRKG